ncbi:capsule assembly Wzi family protein [Marinoscillum furvescens]|uniref:Capsule assembly protein Wzi n=1 Tax=Marinoscillum furvescens DSM 4134 TaxID=1122208 RepID=A0A3D9L511_MARFU|nr:capsule assembly Wzi family protein [Marinoscillum furvescens]RED98010.1 capsule assembly protein Wzi [Marinoscillum furvescens DSM 4134]
MEIRSIVVVSILYFILSFSAFSQKIITPDSYQSALWEFDRVEQYDSGHLALQYMIRDHGDKPISFLDPMIKFNGNTAFPYGYNDGAVWKGKGLNGEFHFGVSGKMGILSYAIQPVVFLAQNREYAVANPNTPYIYPFATNRIDWVQRYGNQSYHSFHLGQSEVKIAYQGFKLALGTQNFIVGHALYFPILMSNNAGGIPNLNIGTDRPINIGYKWLQIGEVEANLIYGLMKESDFFDNDQSNDLRYYNSAHVSFRPSLLPQLTLGFNKVLYKQTKYFDRQDLLSTFYNEFEPVKVVNGDTISSPNDFFDQMASLTGEWKFPESGFRVYAEYALNDFTGSPRVLEPEHSRAYMIGFQKSLKLKGVKFLINYEHSNLSRNLTYLYRPEPTYYIHSFSSQGYTHKGQIMGNSIGPGGNADHLEIKALITEPSLLISFFGRRTEHNKDYFITHDPDFHKHDVSVDFGLSSYWELSNITLGLKAVHSFNHNKYYIIGNNHKNVYFEISLQSKYFNL